MAKRQLLTTETLSHGAHIDFSPCFCVSVVHMELRNAIRNSKRKFIMLNFNSAMKFIPPSDWLKITAIDAHTGGEPFRVIVDGFPELKGETILEKRRYAKAHYDHLRTALMWEPRGHADMYGCILTPSVTSDADFGILFIHNEG